ncbi:MAG: 2-polyprenylphenol 6-hydroxylase [Legionellaceae bacterium]|nr:2-polyprenylphenol 6-hydroxylase [Legionellaceae bacterium]
MKIFRSFCRFFFIYHVIVRRGIFHCLPNTGIFFVLRFCFYLYPLAWFIRKPANTGLALKETFAQLGPIFIKFGQALSTRPDILPLEVTEELSKLRDNAPSFPSDIAIQIIEQNLSAPLHTAFAIFETTPLGSASIAQVHAAQLLNGDEVIVKVVRPHIQDKIQQDIHLMRHIATLLHCVYPASKRLKLFAIIAEFEKHLLRELDMQQEGANASQLRRNFHNSPLLYVPKVYWEYTGTSILVMERIHGIPITDVDTLDAQQINRKKLAEQGIVIFLSQVFRDCFFHADMHPGNIFVNPHRQENPQYICVDFGIVGTLNERDKRYLAENLYAFFTRDYERVAVLHLESGGVPSHIDVHDFANALRAVCEPIFEKPLKDISFSMLLLRLIMVAKQFEMDIQPQLFLLRKTLLTVEGLGRQLYPELDLWKTAKPFLEKWLREQVGFKKFLQHCKQELPFLIEQLPDLPRRLYQMLDVKKTATPPPISIQWGYGFCAGLGLGLLAITLLREYHFPEPWNAPAILGGLILLSLSLIRR